MGPVRPLRQLSDAQLLDALSALSARDAVLEADLLLHLAEVDPRELHLAQGYPSLFAYCTDVLHFSESVAYQRISAARAARSHPRIVEMVRLGELHLSAVRLLVPHLTLENGDELLASARHKSKRAIERMLADRAAKPDVPAVARRVVPERPRATPPATGPGASPPPGPKPSPEPLGAQRFRITLTASAGADAKLEDARVLLWHQIPDGDLAEVYERARAQPTHASRHRFRERHPPHPVRDQARRRRARPPARGDHPCIAARTITTRRSGTTASRTWGPGFSRGSRGAARPSAGGGSSAARSPPGPSS